MKKKFLTVVLGLVAVSLLSGCYQLRSLTWSKDVVGPGDKSTATIGLSPFSDENDGHFFMLVQFLDDSPSGLKVNGVKFDTTKVTADKPKKMSRDIALETAIFDDTNSDCEGVLNSRRGPPPVFSAVFRTAGAVPDNASKPVFAKLKAKLAQDAEGGAIGKIETGVWVDDGDLAPEANSDEDDIFCTGGADTSLFFKN